MFEEPGSVEDVAGVWGIDTAMVVGHTPWQGLVPYIEVESCQEDSAQPSELHIHSSLCQEESSHDSPHGEAFQLSSPSSTMVTVEFACVEGVAQLCSSMSWATASEALIRIVGKRCPHLTVHVPFLCPFPAPCPVCPVPLPLPPFPVPLHVFPLHLFREASTPMEAAPLEDNPWAMCRLLNLFMLTCVTSGYFEVLIAFRRICS